MGMSYDVEHNSVLIPCAYNPYGSTEPVDCELREKSFDFSRWLPSQCAVSKTDEPYIYEQSVEKIKDDNDAEYYANVRALKEKNPLFECCACIGRKGNKVKINYSLDRCAIFQPHGCTKPVCAVTGKERDVTPVNIFCDVKYTENTETLFERTVITKGIKLLDRPMVRECAERKLKEIQELGCEDWIRSKRTAGVPHRIYISRRVGKDLLQDLRDAQEGIEVLHASDLKKEAAQAKRDRRAKRQEAKQRKIEKRLIEGWKKVLLEGVDSDGEPVSDNMKDWARKQLSKRRISVEKAAQVQRQETLF